MRRALALITVAVFVLGGTARADEGFARNGPGDKPEVYVSGPGTDPSGNAGGSGSVVCRLYDVVGAIDPSFWIGVGNEAASLQEGMPYWLVCTDGYINVIIYNPADIIDAGTLARRAFNELPLLYPRPRTAPPVTAKQLVGVKTWLWVDPADWVDQSATASIVGLSATVTARPSKVIWKMGDGTTVTCNGPGTPYNNSRPDNEQSSDCSHIYQHDGIYTVLATIVWTVSWTATNGQGGVLANVQRSTQFPLTVEQRQAVING
jgi:hypothetical protein